MERGLKMCLDNVDNKYSTDDKSVGYGWKVFTQQQDKYYKQRLYGEFFNTWLPYLINRWNKANIVYDDLYDRGFHLFLKKKDAEIWAKDDYNTKKLVVKKVKYRGIICEGTQYFTFENNKLKCVVTKEMLILPNQN